MRNVLKRHYSLSEREIKEALFEWLRLKDIPCPSADAIDCKFELTAFGAELQWTEDFER